MSPRTVNELKALVASGQYMVAFHGTSQQLDGFTEEKVGQGADANSTLGVFLTEVPSSSIDYACMDDEDNEGGQARVYLVALPVGPNYEFSSAEDFFGADEMCQVRTHEQFAELRQQLLVDGFLTASCETGEDVISVALRPEDALILAELDLEQVEELEALIFNYSALLALALEINPSPRFSLHGGIKTASRMAEEDLLPTANPH